MQQFVVPQFIDVEDKIIGPITTRQFLILLTGALIIGLTYKLFDFTLFVVFSLLVLMVVGVIAFLKINGRPFHYFILNLIQTFRRPKLRVWYRDFKDFQLDYGVEESLVASSAKPTEKHYTASRLAELSLIVDTRGAYQGEGEASQVKVAREVI